MNNNQKIEKFKKELDSQNKKNYFLFVFIILTIIYIVDEVASNMGSSMQYEIVSDFFVNRMGVPYTTGTQLLTLYTMPAMAFMLLLPFYKSLADKFGRKIFLMINTVGMGLGLGICMIAPNIYVYVVGALVIQFFQPNDAQVVYIMETAPKEHRAKFCSISKAIALLGVTLIPFVRKVFMKNNPLLWQKAYILPALIGIVVGLCSYFLIKETPVYLEKEIDRLEGKESKQEDKIDNANGGIVNAFKFIFKHKQTKALAACALLFYGATAMTSYYSTVMYEGGMTTEKVTNAMFMIPFFNALTTAISGFITDKMGRKKSAVILTLIAFISVGGFILATRIEVHPYVVGALYGLFIGGFWSVSDLIYFMIPSESTPTNLRSSVIGALSLMAIIGGLLTTLIVNLGLFVTSSYALLCFVSCIPFLGATLYILISKVHETKGVNMDEITGEEWD